MSKYNVAVVGANGAVGEEILRVLEEIKFPIAKLIPLASSKSAGLTVQFNNQDITIQELTENIFEDEEIDIALFSAGGSVSEKFAPYAVKAGALVVDNTSYYRMDDNTPLVVPEVNPQDISLWQQTGIIANPNCSTIQMVQVLKPLHDRYELKRVDVATYQATSGAGKSAMKELVNEMQDFFAFKLGESKHEKFPHQIALNVIPQIDVFTDSGYTKEELKMVNETSKILHQRIPLSATCVRVPTLRGHAEALTLKFAQSVDIGDVKVLLAKAKNIIVLDNPDENLYPMPTTCIDKNETFVGRIRSDLFDDTIVHMFVVADNLRVGAATNAVRIALEWTKMQEQI